MVLDHLGKSNVMLSRTFGQWDPKAELQCAVKELMLSSPCPSPVASSRLFAGGLTVLGI